jgi:4-hydroxy-3-polyprenylbenzoate decarboxylase
MRRRYVPIRGSAVAYDSLKEFIKALEAEGELQRVSHPLDPHLEIPEVIDRVCKQPHGGKALLFEAPTRGAAPVMANHFGSYRRMAMALSAESIEEPAHRITELLEKRPPDGLGDKFRTLGDLLGLSKALPRRVRTGRCKEIIRHGDEASLDALPVLWCWPGDGGPFITLPMVVTAHPETGRRNVGMYRMHVYDERTTGMHWHTHKVGAGHYRGYERRGERMPVAVALGGDPATTFAATAPLPEGIDEFLFAGFLRREPVALVKCETSDLEVPADADYVLEGYVEPGEMRTEGPFGDHTGYYSLADQYPVFHVTCITSAADPIYPATIVGKPPMEDCYMAKATERLFLPMLKLTVPEIVDMNLPLEGIFHNLCIVSIRKSFPLHARKVMNALWGLGQMMFVKMIIVVDEEVNVQDLGEVIWRLGNNTDFARDAIIWEGPVDALDHAGPRPHVGGKIGLDATRKWPTEGYDREWPPDIVMSDEVKARIDALWPELGMD